MPKTKKVKKLVEVEEDVEMTPEEEVEAAKAEEVSVSANAVKLGVTTGTKVEMAKPFAEAPEVDVNGVVERPEIVEQHRVMREKAAENQKLAEARTKSFA